MTILILGGDGFCGWPTALHLSAQGNRVVIVDNLSRRNIDNELEVQSLTPIQTSGVRIEAWRALTGREIEFVRLDVATEYDRLLELIRSTRPEAIVHFAEQRAAPYSMKSSWHKRYTVNNNLNATNNVLAAIVESREDIHLVHLGTMGVYGYSSVGVRLPEGYLTVKMTNDEGDDVEQEILYPTNPGSIYHMTKTQDQLFFAFYNKNDQVRVTDLCQGGHRMAALVEESTEEPAEARHERADAEQGSDQDADQEEEWHRRHAPDPALGFRVPPVGIDGFREEVIGDGGRFSGAVAGAGG